MNHRFSHLALAALIALAITGCGSKESAPTAEQPAATTAPAGKTVDATTTGSVTGTVTLDGKAAPEKPINMSAEPYCQKANSGPVVPPTVVTDDKGDLGNVVIFVKDGLATTSLPPPRIPC